METNKDIPTFEKSVQELEKIVASLEKGDLPLEEQLKSFEKGVAVSRDCLGRLEEIEQKVEKLVKSSDGKVKTANFDPS